jgi:hypothetical protein
MFYSTGPSSNINMVRSGICTRGEKIFFRKLSPDFHESQLLPKNISKCNLNFLSILILRIFWENVKNAVFVLANVFCIKYAISMYIEPSIKKHFKCNLLLI